MVFEYNSEEPIVITDLKNKYYSNFYKFLTLPYNYIEEEYREQYLEQYDQDDIRNGETRRESNKIIYDQAYILAESMVDDIISTMDYFKVGVTQGAPFSTQAPYPFQWGPAFIGTDNTPEPVIEPEVLETITEVADGIIKDIKLRLQDTDINDANEDRHGFLPKLPGDANLFLNGLGKFVKIKALKGKTVIQEKAPSDTSEISPTSERNYVTEEQLTLIDSIPNITTPNIVVPDPVTDQTIEITDNTTNNATTGKHGFLPKLPGGTTVFLDGDGNFSTPAGSGDMSKAENLSGLVNYATARSNLGLGTLATQSGTFSGDSSGTNTGDQTSTAGLANSTNKNLVTDAELTIIGNTSGINTGDQTISDATITTSDITTNNASITKHGFLKKLSNVSTEYLDGKGNFLPVRLAPSYIEVTSNYNTVAGNTIINCTSGTFDLTLVNCSDVPAGEIIIIKNTGTGLITILTGESEPIDELDPSGNTLKLSQWDSLMISNTGVFWFIIGPRPATFN